MRMLKKEKLDLSIIMPCRNEENAVAKAIQDAKAFLDKYGISGEILVVDNASTDKSASVARKNGARVVYESLKGYGRAIRTGIAESEGKVLIIGDADTTYDFRRIGRMYKMLKSGRYIGGGAPIRFERYSLALWLNDLMCRVAFGLTGLYCGIFWAERSTFEAIGGFVDKRAFEDAETAKKLRKFGKSHGKRYGVLRKNHLINSTRKYDKMGDWMYFKLMVQNSGAMLKAALGDSSEYDKLIDKLFYDYNG